MVTAKKILKKAVSQLGTKENPSGSNTVKYNTLFYGRKVSGSAYPWCCVFVWWVFKKCGASKLFCEGQKVAYCPTVESWGLRNNLLVNKPKAGDLVLFEFNKAGRANHIGILESVNKDGTYTTIEGNTGVGNDANGGCVMRRQRTLGQIRCFIRPNYDKPKKKVADEYTKKEFIKDVQKACGAKVDGVAGSETLSKTVTLSVNKNRKHDAVLAVQKRLNALGYACKTDGVYGKKTKTAVKKFQKSKGCVVDGIITANEKTWKKLLGMG